MKKVITNFARRLSLGDPKQSAGLTVYPVCLRASKGVEYRLLRDALKEGLVEIRERDQARVSELIVENRAAEPVLIVQGQELIGGRQNRIVNATILLAPQQQMVLPVVCGEQGRWHSISAAFKAEELASPSIRKSIQEDMSYSLQARGELIADQGRIWNHVGHLLHLSGAHSPTRDLSAAYEQQNAKLREIELALPYPDGAVGMVMASGRSVLGADVFDRPQTAESTWSTLIRSYGVETVTEKAAAPPSKDAASALSRSLARAEVETFPVLFGVGTDVRPSGKELVGSALVADGEVVHLNAFTRKSRS